MAVDGGTSAFWVEVAYATPEKQTIIRVEVSPGCTVERAIELSGIREQFPEMDVRDDAVGVFSRKVKLDHALRAGDRVEIYRPLIADPKEARRRRAQNSPDG